MAGSTEPAGSVASSGSNLAAMGAQTVTDLVGIILNKMAMDAARREAKEYDARDFAYQEKMDNRNFGLSKENLRLSQESLGLQKDRFKLDSAIQGYGLSQNAIQRVEQLLNNSVGLKDRVLGTWRF
jgi:hypothetical protein